MLRPSLSWLALCALPACASPRVAVVERAVITMGTTLGVEVGAATPDSAQSAAEAGVRCVLAADRRWSSWRGDSTLRRLHDAAVGAPVATDRAFRDGLRLAALWSARTEGAFDPAVGRLLEAWGVGYDLPTEPPTAAALDRARATCGPRQFQVDGQSVSRRSDARLAEGGFVKGLALDDAMRAARNIDGVTAVQFDFGGQLAWWSQAGATRRVGVASPDDRRQFVGTIELPAAGSVATSGNSEHGIVVDGVRYAHIVDPRTGHPVNDWGSVTVVVTGDDHPACAADCLSTALFVLGPREGLRLATRLPGVDALFLERTGDGLRVHRTPGLLGFTLSDNSITH
jgi:FAD:protein FMN transferase